ncbi:MAG: hypothetical protein JW750_08270 [Anaerolineaceae bacterium]|nr:hypothetical protein [Anaerolineaceae bacterium]
MESFQNDIHNHFDELREAISTPKGDWLVKGFIDLYRNIYTISADTKVISKIIELMIFPVLSNFARTHNYKIFLAEHQNHYPDITFQTEKGELIAVDLKSSYRTSKHSVNGMTLGAFTGYFRNRKITKNITFPYSDYSYHYVLGVIYSRRTKNDDETKVYSLKDLESINSVVKDFEFIIQEKWKIASDKPGSGNTKNIGSTKSLKELRSGNGKFTKYGIHVFDDYWMNYLTNDMAKLIDSPVPYTNLDQYFDYRKLTKK